MSPAIYLFFVPLEKIVLDKIFFREGVGKMAQSINVEIDELEMARSNYTKLGVAPVKVTFRKLPSRRIFCTAN